MLKTKIIRIFVTGFFNAGKSTLVHTLDNEAIHMEKELRVHVNAEKTHTTTGFDLGKLIWVRPNLNIDTEGVLMSQTEYVQDKEEYKDWNLINVELKGCPGQMQFSTVRQVLSRGSDGVIFLIDGCDMMNIGNAMVILEETKATLGFNCPMKIIANKSDREDYCGCEMISNMIGEHVYKGSAKCNIGLKDAIIQVLKMILNESIENNFAESGVVY
ncbi:MAG: 50S ribosome-binding GTPase [Candidatus Lokiarchaeota archaeon]|jgi:signal recognition particle receptor subunit beta